MDNLVHVPLNGFGHQASNEVCNISTVRLDGLVTSFRTHCLEYELQVRATPAFLDLSVFKDYS